MDIKKFIQALGFLPKENTSDIFVKKYSLANDYAVEIDFDKSIIDFGKKVKGESKTTQNFSQAENWVILECVDRLFEKGYQPQYLTLEKTWKTGHGTSGRLDILVSRPNGKAYMMIECKTWGTEFEKELKNLEKNGGQLFTYFQQDKNAEVLMLYTSKLEGKNIEYKNTIVKIEEDYRQTGNVKDFYERWSKLPKLNGIFEEWVNPYEFQSKALTRKNLKELKQEDSSFIFNRFLEILRHNVVSDKPNAFNKIFTLFLCKIIDEDRGDDEQLHFQWLEGEDDDIKFQKRLTDLYNRGMRELLEKNVTDVSDDEFDRRFQQVDDKYKEQFKDILTEIRLKKNNEFAIKEVYDDASFKDNAKVVKEIVELLQGYRIRYNYRQQFLSDFFELLLTTGLKQESGQFFTPVPLARYIIRCLPFEEIIQKKIDNKNAKDLLPVVIDYAAGSGHFLTESMEVMQHFIDSKVDPNKYPTGIKKQLQSWKTNQFNWAEDYVYGIEKDYRLVKTAKVSCYLHGDGLAKVIHGDGLDDFETSTVYKDLLTRADKTYTQDNKQFDIVISNPPYSVSAFKGTMMEDERAKKAFELYGRLTDQSSEIECLFIERTKQLLKDGGVAGIILPSSILSNTGIYTQAREIILKYFDILGITELGSGTFMATGTNTVTLFLRRRNNADAVNVEEAVKKFFINKNDVTVNGIEKPVQKYVAHVWEGLSFDDYITLLNQKPNGTVKKHELYAEYDKKIKAKNEAEKWTNILALEQEKLLYFIITYPQRLVLVKTGEKDAEKRFLGYEFSTRRGSEGIHPIQRGKTIDDCTQLYDAESYDNPNKASTFIYKSFKNQFHLDIPIGLQKNVEYLNLVDMLTFDRTTFEKNLSFSAKKKVNIESKWEIKKLNQLVSIVRGASPRPIREYITDANNGVNWVKIGDVKPNSKFITETQEKIIQEGVKKSRLVKKGDFIISNSMSFGRPYIMDIEGCIHDGWLLLSDFVLDLNKDFLYYMLSDSIIQQQFKEAASGGTSVDNLNIEKVNHIQIPFPPKKVQEKIVKEIEALEKKEKIVNEKIVEFKKDIRNIIKEVNGEYKKLRDLCRYSDKKINSTLLTPQNYIGVDNMLQNMAGKVNSNFVPSSGTSTEYKAGDILISNIRPYLKKIWFASNSGGSSNDVLVLQKAAENVVSKYLYYILKQDDFFDYEMQKTKGVKMPRGDKQHIMDYRLNIPSLSEQQKIVIQIEEIENKIAKLEKEIAEIPKQKEAILKKYL